MHKFICLLFLTFACNISNAQNLFEEKPFFVENFSSNKNYKQNWDFYKGAPGGHKVFYNGDSKANVKVKRGKLEITLRKGVENGKVKYTSVRMLSKTNIPILYGKLDIRAKCPVSKGIWPALWMKAINRGSFSGEIDLLEYWSRWNSKKFQMNFHLWGEFGGKEDNHVQYPKVCDVDISKYHVYTLEWFQDRMVMKVDGRTYYEIKKGDIPGWPFDKPYRLILALAYAGDHDTSGTDDSKLPQTMKIDWIKYYRLKDLK